jgi:hypothetical protein
LVRRSRVHSRRGSGGRSTPFRLPSLVKNIRLPAATHSAREGARRCWLHCPGPAEDKPAGRARRFLDQVHSGSVHCGHCNGSRREPGFAVVCSALLASNDVLNVIGEERLRVFRKVFAAMIGTFTDGLPKPLAHQAAWPTADELLLEEWQRNFRHGSLPRTRHWRGLLFPQGLKRSRLSGMPDLRHQK